MFQCKKLGLVSGNCSLFGSLPLDGGTCKSNFLPDQFPLLRLINTLDWAYPGKTWYGTNHGAIDLLWASSGTVKSSYTTMLPAMSALYLYQLLLPYKNIRQTATCGPNVPRHIWVGQGTTITRRNLKQSISRYGRGGGEMGSFFVMSHSEAAKSEKLT